jgi:superfamily II DNA or RNA helicase
VAARLEELTPDAVVRGLVPGESVTIVAARASGTQSAVVAYRTKDGQVDELVVYRDQEPDLDLVDSTRRQWSFSADAKLFRLVAEARRIRLAYLFDPRLAVHLSLIDPLPHQITAVYGEMLPRQPLRFCLADDPGAGKTIMAGLYIKELMLRGDLQRCLVVAPGSLVAQWQDELWEKFGLDFSILTRGLIEDSRTADPFEDRPLLLARLDHLSRRDDLVERLATTEWDLVVVDEAHRMAAHYFGNEVKETKRYRLGKTLGATARHFLLMTATPHAGKDEDFQLFMALLDADRFEGKPRDGAHMADSSDLMRRMVKEKLLQMDGRPLFPERRAYTVGYELTDAEMALYGQVTEYVAEEMGRAERLSQEGEGRRANRVGFAVTVLQRRLASSPAAIYQSLARRRKRLEAKAAEVRTQARAAQILAAQQQRLAVDVVDDLDDEIDDLDTDELETLEEQLVDEATSARTLAELETEIATLGRLEAAADAVRRSGVDKKWTELRGILADAPEMFEDDGTRRKLIVFTEHRDTLNYLVSRLTDYLGRPEAVVTIHGGVAREQRRVVQERFTQDAACQILVATDAAGEGLNLQRAHLLVNYDLPWNPNRIEQRFGRVHRIGQTEVCHLWNLVASETREGQVYHRLLDKLAEMREALGKDQVFDVLGDALPGSELKDLLIQAIRYGNRPEVRAQLDEVIDARVGEGLPELVRQHALSSEMLSAADMERIRADMLEAQARKLQPGYVHAWFVEALGGLGGRMADREAGRYEVTFVPAEVRHRDRSIGTSVPVLPRYQRVTFEKELVRVQGLPMAELVAPGHPLLEAVLDITLERHGHLLRDGAVLVDPNAAAREPRVLVFLEHAVTDARSGTYGARRTVSRRFEFAELSADREPRPAGYAPYLDVRPPTPEEAAAIPALVKEIDWLGEDLDARATDYGIDVLAREHLAEVRAKTLERVEKVKAAVQERLTREITYWDHRAADLGLQASAGKTPRMNPDRAAARADELQRRKKARLAELDREAQLASQPPIVVGAALVIPATLLVPTEGGPVAAHAVDTTVGERRAVDAVLAAEAVAGRQAEEMPHNHPGYDVRSTGPDGQVRFIEVKGRIAGAGTFSVTQNELRFASNIPNAYVLGLVEISTEGAARDQVRYLRRPYGSDVRLPFDTTSTNLAWQRYWDRAKPPSQEP